MSRRICVKVKPFFVFCFSLKDVSVFCLSQDEDQDKSRLATDHKKDCAYYLLVFVLVDFDHQSPLAE